MISREEPPKFNLYKYMLKYDFEHINLVSILEIDSFGSKDMIYWPSRYGRKGYFVV